MTTREVIVAETEIRCHALHPEAETNPRFHRQPHDAFIMRIPFAARFTGRVYRRFEQGRPGYLPARCKCGKISEYEIIAPPATQAAV